MKVLAFLAALVLLPDFVPAAEIGDRKINFDYEIGWYSRYVGNTNGWNLYTKKDGVFQHSLIASFSSGLYTGFWHSFSLDGGMNSDFGDEGPNFFIGVNKYIKGLNFDLSYSYFRLFDLRKMNDDICGLALRVTFPKIAVGFVPYWYNEINWPVASGGPENGYSWNLGAKYSLELPKFFIGDQKNQLLSFDFSL